EINGEKTLGYIHHKHVEKITEKKESIQGIALKKPTNIRELASTKADIVTSLPIGTIIDLETFTDNWYKASVKVNGKEKNGYIHKLHIADFIDSNQESFKGIGINSPTYVRE